MFERFTDRARRVVVLSQEEARLLNHNYIGTEHILLGLISEGEGVAAQVLESLEISLSDARTQVEEIIGHGGQAPSGHIPFTPRAKKVLELSLREALQLGHNYIGTEHVLLGLIREGEGVASQVLTNLGAELSNVRQQVIQLLSDDPGRASTTSRTYVRAVSTVAAQVPWTCSFCGRDLWEAEHYVAGPAAFMCAICIATSQLALEAAPADQQILTLPPRVFGTPPDDDPSAVDQIVEALDAVFGSVLTDRSAVYLEDGEQLVPILLATRERHNVRVSDVVVERVRFSTPLTATVGFAMTLENGARYGFVGTMMRVDKRWLVTRPTVADTLKPAGVSLPPPAK